MPSQQRAIHCMIYARTGQIFFFDYRTFFIVLMSPSKYSVVKIYFTSTCMHCMHTRLFIFIMMVVFCCFYWCVLFVCMFVCCVLRLQYLFYILCVLICIQCQKKICSCVFVVCMQAHGTKAMQMHTNSVLPN